MHHKVDQRRSNLTITASLKPPGSGGEGGPPACSPALPAGVHTPGPGGVNKLAGQADGLTRLELADNPAGPHWFVYEPRTGRTLATYEVASPARHDLENLGFVLKSGTRLSERWTREGASHV